MTRRAGFLTALLLLILLCGCAKPSEVSVSPEPEAVEQPAESAPVSEAAPALPAESEPATVLPAESEPEPDTAEAASAVEAASPTEVTLPDEPLPLTEDGAIAIAEAEATKAIYPRWSSESVFEAFYAEYYDLETGATLPWPGGPSWRWTTEAGAAAFTWYDGEFWDEDFGHLTSDMHIWCVRLADSVDALNDLFVYLNADTGDLLGACRVTD